MREKLISTFHELDTVGLILLGFGWSLVRPSVFAPSHLTAISHLPLHTHSSFSPSPSPRTQKTATRTRP